MKAPPSLLALGEFARRPDKVGSPFPATPRLVDRVLEKLDWARIDVMVEYGPGTGRFTFEALRRLKPGATLFAIESGRGFASALQRRNSDARLKVVEGTAEEVVAHLAARGAARADCILTGVPFSTMSDAAGGRLMAESAAALAPGGVLAAYQMRRTIEPLLDRHFAEVEHEYEWRNIPPCHLYWARSAS